MHDFLRNFLILVGTATLLGLFFGGITLLTYEINNCVEKIKICVQTQTPF